ncbi:MAG: AI-2E family transporter [Alphaproteobacteria bacterium]|nr:AI-2E family transporter [Alphaproteobacteria bacterium]
MPMKGKQAQRLSWMAQAVFWFSILVILCAFLYVFRTVLAPFFLGFIIAYLLNPLIRRLNKNNFSRKSATLFILTTFFAVVALIFAVVVPLLAREMAAFASALPRYIDNLWAMATPYVSDLQDYFGIRDKQDLAEKLNPVMGPASDTGKNILTGVFSGGLAVIDFTVTIFITPIVAFFLMKDWPKLTKWVDDLMPQDHENEVHGILKQIDKKLAGFVRGQLLVCLVLGVGYAIALMIAGLNYGFFIGLMAGALSIIPFVGSTIGLLVALLVAWFQVGTFAYVAIIAAIFLFGQFLEGNFLSPKLVGDSVGMHPLWVLFSVMAGGAIFGILGMLLAVPVAAIVGVLMGAAIIRYKNSAFYRDTGQNDSAKKNKTKS